MILTVPFSRLETGAFTRLDLLKSHFYHEKKSFVLFDGLLLDAFERSLWSLSLMGNGTKE